MYNLFIYLMALGVSFCSLFNKKLRTMRRGHKDTWRQLKKIRKERREKGAPRLVWFHAASLGEFEQGRPLMERLRREQPEVEILLTFFSPSGYEVRKNYEVADYVLYLPFDTPFNARRFVKAVRPWAAYFIKYEFWTNYLHQLARHGVQTYSVSSIFRKNQIFFRRIGRRYARVLNFFTHIYVQNEVSKDLLSTIGIENVSIVGDTRFDRVLDVRHAAAPVPLVERFAGCWKVLVCGSTWPEDEAILADFFNRHRDLRMVLAPHVVSEDHLLQIEGRLQRPSLRLSRATLQNVQDADCLIIDSYGLLSSIYRYATVAYVGGGFGAGIHNVPEAAVYGVPVLFGPRHTKFREAVDLVRLEGAFAVDGKKQLAARLNELLTGKERLARCGRNAAEYIASHAGAADRIYRETLAPPADEPHPDEDEPHAEED